MTQTVLDPAAAALEDPGRVVRCMILDAIKMHVEFTPPSPRCFTSPRE